MAGHRALAGRQRADTESTGQHASEPLTGPLDRAFAEAVLSVFGVFIGDPIVRPKLWSP